MRSSKASSRGTQPAVRATSEKTEPVSCRVERESGRDVKDGGKGTELHRQLAKPDAK
jgi:hypothetical protein